MKTSQIKIFALMFVCSLFLGQAVFAATAPSVQTNSATNIQNNSATLNGSALGLGGDYSATVWFQWGIDTNYGYTTNQLTINYPEIFQFQVNNLAPNTTFHYRAVIQNSYTTIYGQDLTFYTGQSQSSQITVNAGPDQYVNQGQSVTLQGSGYANNGSPINYNWSCVGGSISNPNIAQPTYTPPYVNGQGTYTCTLTVSTNTVSSSDSMTVYVNYQQIVGGITVQTNSATSISNNQATLQGYVGMPYFGTNNVWFQWGTGTGYGNITQQQAITNSGSFNQNITGLLSNTTYHFRAVAQTPSGGTVYGQDMTFNSNGSSYSGNLTVQKQVINLTTGNLTWQNSVAAKPGDILSFAITIQGQNQDVHNVVVQDLLPANLIYRGNLVLNTSINYPGNLSGINIGTIPARGIEIVSYQVQVASAGNFVYGTTSLNNSATVTSTENGSQTASANVVVTNSQVSGATDISTGVTNNLMTDSFFFPLFLIALMGWLYFTGRVYQFADWLGEKIN